MTTQKPPSLNIIRSYLGKEFWRAARIPRGSKAQIGPEMLPGTFGHGDQAGKRKHRIIQDLKWDGVDDVASTEERAVLPRGIDHAADLAILAETHTRVETTILDFVDAFVAVPLDPTEQPFNCAEVDGLEGRDGMRIHLAASPWLRREGQQVSYTGASEVSQHETAKG